MQVSGCKVRKCGEVINIRVSCSWSMKWLVPMSQTIVGKLHLMQECAQGRLAAHRWESEWRGQRKVERLEVVNNSEWATLPPRVLGVPPQHTSIYLALGNKLKGNLISLRAAGRLRLQREPPRSSWRLLTLTSVLPCMKSPPVRWRLNPLLVYQSSFSYVTKSPTLKLQGTVGILSMIAYGQMQSCCVKLEVFITHFPSIALWKPKILDVWAIWTQFKLTMKPDHEHMAQV